MNATLGTAAGILLLALSGCAGSGGAAQEPIAATTEESSTPSPPLPSDSPLSVLPPGTHSAPSFWPPLTFTAPDGWLTEPEADGQLTLVPDTSENRELIRSGGYPPIFVNVFTSIEVAAEDCSDSAEPGVEWTADDMVGTLAARPGLITEEPVPVTVGGLSGLQIDLSIDPDWSGNCSGGGPYVPLVYSPGFISWGAEPGEQWRIIVLDVAGLPSGKYTTVMIVVYSATAEGWDEHLAASTEVIESFEFDTTPPHP